MGFQAEPLLFILWLIIATVIVFLIMYIAVRVVVSKTKASDKKIMILLLAFIAVFLLPIVVGAIMIVLNAIGGAVATLRDLLDGGGQNFLALFGPIIFFLLLLALRDKDVIKAKKCSQEVLKLPDLPKEMIEQFEVLTKIESRD